MANYILKRPVEILLYSLMLSMAVFIALMIYFYSVLQEAQPLENFNAKFIDPVTLSTNTEIVAAGSFDRRVMCNLLDFRVVLTNTATGDVILFNKTHLTKAPVANLHPGTSLPVSFNLAVPETLYTGIWAPEYHGRYLCRNGIFSSVKDQTVILGNIRVVE
jgi:hypothetical protein